MVMNLMVDSRPVEQLLKEAKFVYIFDLLMGIVMKLDYKLFTSVYRLASPLLGVRRIAAQLAKADDKTLIMVFSALTEVEIAIDTLAAHSQQYHDKLTGYKQALKSTGLDELGTIVVQYEASITRCDHARKVCLGVQTIRPLYHQSVPYLAVEDTYKPHAFSLMDASAFVGMLNHMRSLVSDTPKNHRTPFGYNSDNAFRAHRHSVTKLYYTICSLAFLLSGTYDKFLTSLEKTTARKAARPLNLSLKLLLSVV